MRFIFTSSSQSSSLFQKVIRILVVLVVVGVVLTIAAVLFVYIAIFAAVVFGYWWWKTRNLRKSLRSASEGRMEQDSFTQGGNVIEGEIIRDSSAVPTVLLGEVTKIHTTSEPQ